MTRRIAFAAVLAGALAAGRPVAAEWRPASIQPSAATLGAVLDANAAAAGIADRAYAQRRERWTYRNGTRTLPVRVAVRNADVRATVGLGAAEYSGGRTGGAAWRSDANGVTHATLSDSQGDAIDRLPQSLFPFARADCALAGESSSFGAPAWVIVDRPARDKAHWFYVDQATGLIAHEVTREGRRVIVTTFSDFKVFAGLRRAFRWQISDGDAADDLDVAVDGIEPQALSAPDVAPPRAQRLFAPPADRPDAISVLPATFHDDRIEISVTVGSRSVPFVLDTGTASITMDRGLAQHESSGVVLEHATIPSMRVGPLMLDDVSVLAIPAFVPGILGYDFFLGHVLHIDYRRRRVEVLTPHAARPAFSDPANHVFAAAFDEGIPLARAAFGAAAGDRFALDTGSQELVVLAPFLQRNPQLALTPAHFGGRLSGLSAERLDFLEGSIVVGARRAPAFALGPLAFRNVFVAAELPKAVPDTIDIPVDGIVGTDELAQFEWWFDYDDGLIAARRNVR